MKYGWTKSGPCQVLQVDGGKVQIQLPTRKTAMWVSKTHLLPTPKAIRLLRKAEFDQKCGCAPVVDIKGTECEVYNIYGKYTRYAASGVTQGSDLSPFLRRKFLRENGFMRASGKTFTLSNVAEKVFGYIRDGYHIVDAPKVRVARKSAEKVVEKKEETPVLVVAETAATV